ncbi:hypothetical protein RF11_13965 [Thelohanellus kitauei]|uniref:Uncharacterized protein n=1 Tax=Thelohanellus kitauei TaxID=669202 RepID=A0A0C2IVW4_THEKT|nr:hypothetical protein RF11_13965 [Thelohanellus kitauei]
MKDGERSCATHFYIGCVNSKENSSSSCDLTDHLTNDYVIFNHLQFDILYKDLGDHRAMIVEVIVTPKSFINCKDKFKLTAFNKDTKSLHIDYTYSVNYIVFVVVNQAKRF